MLSEPTDSLEIESLETDSFKKQAFSNREGLIVFAMFVAVLLAFAVLFVDRLRADARRTRSLEKLREIALVCHNYESVHQLLPPSQSVNRFGVELGWEARIATFFGWCSRGETNDRSQPWYSPANEEFFKTKIDAFISPHVDENFDANGYPLNHYAATLEAFPIGMGNKLDKLDPSLVMIGEIATGFQAWGKPGNARTIGNGVWFGKNSFGNPEYNGYAYANVDASTHYMLLDRPRRRTEE
jgi:hypothetical protein